MGKGGWMEFFFSQSTQGGKGREEVEGISFAGGYCKDGMVRIRGVGRYARV